MCLAALVAPAAYRAAHAAAATAVLADRSAAPMRVLTPPGADCKELRAMPDALWILCIRDLAQVSKVLNLRVL